MTTTLIKEAAEKKVKEYVQSEEFKLMVESLKRRERERMLLEVQTEMEQEKSTLIATAKEKLKNELKEITQPSSSANITHISCSDGELADAILLQNKLRMEEQQRKIFEQKQREEANRLEEVLQKKQLDVSFNLIHVV